MKASELRTKSADELQQELASLLKAQFSMRMQKATQQLSNTSKLKEVRRDIARLRTIMTEKAAEQVKA
jgi:large subunit ribosomal protein L29